jgi:hypothetical protein
MTQTFTPVFNVENFPDLFMESTGLLPLNQKGLLQELETILLPNTPCVLLKCKESDIAQVETKAYPYQGPHFVDSRFFDPITELKDLPTTLRFSSEEILNKLSSLLGNRYFWGGSSLGVEKLLELYPPKKPLMNLEDRLLKGFDCSGLMYYVTDGYTPRNTSSWIDFGSAVPIENLQIEEIQSLVKPLDAIIWKGHILFIYDETHTIESRLGQGVILTNLRARLEEIIEKDKRVPQNKWQESSSAEFLIRRWISF